MYRLNAYFIVTERCISFRCTDSEMGLTSLALTGPLIETKQRTQCGQTAKTLMNNFKTISAVWEKLIIFAKTVSLMKPICAIRYLNNTTAQYNTTD